MTNVVIGVSKGKNDASFGHHGDWLRGGGAK